MCYKNYNTRYRGGDDMKPFKRVSRVLNTSKQETSTKPFTIIDSIVGKLKVLKYVDHYDQPNEYVLVKCECGTEKVVQVLDLLTTKAQSCTTCSQKSNIIIPTTAPRIAVSTTPEYINYNSMINKCTYLSYSARHLYYDRGITICDDWRSFDNFLRDMGPMPEGRHVLARRDDDGNFCKENCYWKPKGKQVEEPVISIQREYKGIVRTEGGKFLASIIVDGETIHFDQCKTLKAAIILRQKAEIKHYGDVYTKYPIRRY